MVKKLSYFAAAALTVGLLGSADADVVTGITYIDIPPENVSATSSSSGYLASYLTRNPEVHNCVPEAGGFCGLDRLWEETGGHGTNPNVGGMWLVEIHEFAPDPVWYVTFDLGAEFDLSEIRIWNWNENLDVTIDRSTKDFEVRVAGANGVFGDPVLTDVLQLGSRCCGIDGSPAEGGVDFSETFPLVQDDVQFVRIFPLTNYGNTFGVGLSEVRIRERFETGGVPGDYDGNGTVGPEDYEDWKSQFGQSVTPGAGADGSQNGLVDAEDYVVWRDNLGGGESGAASASSIPEPASVFLFLVSIVTLVVLSGPRCRPHIT